MYKTLIPIVVLSSFFFSSCGEKTLGPDDVEYREMKMVRILYEIAQAEPFGSFTDHMYKEDLPMVKFVFELVSEMV